MVPLQLGLVVVAAVAGAAAAVPRLPGWYLEHRTHAHTRLEIDGPFGCQKGVGGWNCSAVFSDAGARFASLGVPAYVRHSHTGSEGLMWPSRTSPKEGWHPLVQETGRHLPAEFLAEATAANVRVIFYHYMKCQNYFARRHPEWVQRTANGSAIGAQRCPEGALSTCAAGWRRVYISQILELVEAGAAAGAAGQDGTAFYFDEYPSNPTGDWNPSCRSEFAKRFGYPMPDNATRDVLAFNQAMTEQYFRELTHAIGNATSSAAALVSITFAPSLDNHGWKNYSNTVEASFSAQSVAKVEFAKGLVARPVSSKPPSMPNTSCSRGWSAAIVGRSPGSVLGEANASSYAVCQAACCANSACKAVIFQSGLPRDNCHLLDRTYNGNLQCLPGQVTPIVANFHSPGVPPSMCPAAGPQVTPGAPIAPDVLLSWAWALGSAAAEWRPPHTWIPYLQSAEQAVCTTSALRAYGHVANPDHVEGKIPDAGLFSEVYKIAADLDRASSSGSSKASPPRALRYAAVLHSERARNALYAGSTHAEADGEGLVAAWKQLLYPAAGMWEALIRAGVPRAVVPEWLLEKLASQHHPSGESCGGFAVILAPAKGFLDRATEAALAVCEEGGATVIRAEVTDDWEDTSSRARLGQAMLRRAMAAGTPSPLSFATRQTASAPRHVVAYELPANSTWSSTTAAAAAAAAAADVGVSQQAPLLLHVLNDFSWCSPEKPSTPLPPSAPPVAAGLKIVVSAPVGSSSATAHDVLTGERFPLTKIPGEASQLELTLPGFQQFLVLRVDFDMPGDGLMT